LLEIAAAAAGIDKDDDGDNDDDDDDNVENEGLAVTLPAKDRSDDISRIRKERTPAAKTGLFNAT
jgi:hypothetical protein